MAKSIQVDNAQKRLERFETAKTRSDIWRTLLEQAYLYALPEKSKFDDVFGEGIANIGKPRNVQVYDHTAVLGVQNFANNLQAALIPPYTHWAIFEPGTEVPDAQRQNVLGQLQTQQSIFFDYLNQSNFNQAANESFQDLAVGTGVLLINKGTIDRPLRFDAVPIAEIVFEEGPYGLLENFWRNWWIPARVIFETWPDGNYPPEFMSTLEKAPETPFEMIEGVLTYNQNPKDKQIYYYVSLRDFNHDIMAEWRPYNPFLGFRYSKTSGEYYGRGPVLFVLPSILAANKLVEFNLASAKFNAYPAYTAIDTGAFNPYQLRLEPGAIIPIDPSFGSTPPIQPIPRGGDASWMELNLKDLRDSINGALFADPLGPPNGPSQTATEVTIRSETAARQMGAAFGRLITEFLEPLVQRVIIILSEFGLMQKIEVDNKVISISYQSPIINLQQQDELQKAQAWIQFLAATFGQFGILATNATEIPSWSAQKLGVDMELVQAPSEVQAALGQFLQTIQGQLQPPPQQGLQGAPAGQPPQAVPAGAPEVATTPTPFEGIPGIQQ